jgi:hypothetical protein
VVGDSGYSGISGSEGLSGYSGIYGDSGYSGVGIPAGGTSGQVLRKKSNSDYDVEWYTL